MKSTIHRRIVLPALATLFLLSGSLRAGDFDSTPGVHFDDSKKIDVQGVLIIYKTMSSSELVMDSRAAEIVTPIKWGVDFGKSFTKEEAIKLMEKTLLEQAGIVPTRLDEKRVSVTHNDALPIKKPKT